jgi:multidrug efflux system outer membrane protein
MNISGFFIQRPIFAAMLSALILLAGLLALPSLPIVLRHRISNRAMWTPDSPPPRRTPHGGVNSAIRCSPITLPVLQAAEKRHGYRLAVLLGVDPGTLDEQLAPVPVRTMAAPLPIGNITALLGKAVSRAWLVNPAVSWPALDLGTVHARLRGAKAEADGALANYQKAVLLALEDFENACVGYSAQEARLASVLEQAQASRNAAQLAEIQYREGSINFLVLLDAQRTLLQAEDELAQVEAAANTSAVAVYKALGGAAGSST